MANANWRSPRIPGFPIARVDGASRSGFSVMQGLNPDLLLPDLSV